MKFKRSGNNPYLNSCTTIALANWLNGGKIITPATKTANNGKIELRHLELYVKKGAKDYGVELPTGDWFGIRSDILKKIYHNLNLKFTSAIIDGARFPQKCIFIYKKS